MDFPPVNDIPFARLAHLVEATKRGNVRTRRYATYPVAIRRPDKGTVTGRAYCGTCRKAVEVKVRSVRRVRLRQWSWLAVSVTAVTLVVAGTVDHLLSNGSGGGGSGLLAFGWLAGVLGTPLGFVKWWREDGVRIVKSGPPGSDDAHSVQLTTRYPSR